MLVLSKNLKIVLSVTIAFIIAFGSSSIFLKENFVDRVEVSVKKEIEFYSQDFNPKEEKIFILGSSHIMAVNTTLIENKLSSEGHNFVVYNLAKGGDVPKDRLPALDFMIKSKPKIIVYGISERDFRSTIPIQQDAANSPESPLPNLQNIFDEILWQISGTELSETEFLSNPKLTTLVAAYNFIENITGEIETKEKWKDIPPFENTPFFRIGEVHTKIRDYNEIKNIFENIYKFDEIPPAYKNPQVISFKKILEKSTENDIKIIVFVTPQHEVFQNGVPKKVETQFNNVLDEVSKQHNIEIYSFYDRYNGLEIWNNPSHVAVNENAMIFSEDISELILKEVEP